MKRHVAIVGSTPEFLRWSIRQTCSIRNDTELASVDQTEKRLRAIRTAGAVLNSGVILDGIAVRRTDDGSLQGFRLGDVFDLWGGQSGIVSKCENCPANICHSPDVNGLIAGCCGWLDSENRSSQWHKVTDTCWPGECPSVMLVTQPRWYGLWNSGPLAGIMLEFAIELFARIQKVDSPIHDNAVRFIDVLTRARDQQLMVDVELVPAGFSDGIIWTIGRHCAQCKAPFQKNARSCTACGKSGQGHPEIRKRVLGHRPWVPLTTVVGEAHLNAFCERFENARPWRRGFGNRSNANGPV